MDHSAKATMAEVHELAILQISDCIGRSDDAFLESARGSDWPKADVATQR
jgi:hypothetical protein